MHRTMRKQDSGSTIRSGCISLLLGLGILAGVGWSRSLVEPASVTTASSPSARPQVPSKPPQVTTQSEIQLCQAVLPVLCGVDCQGCGNCREARWQASQPIPREVFAQGEYIGPARTAHVPEYRLRVDDQMDFIFRFTHEESGEAYRLGVGDEIVIESLTDPTLNRGDLNQGRGLVIQPDETITLPLLGGAPHC